MRVDYISIIIVHVLKSIENYWTISMPERKFIIAMSHGMLEVFGICNIFCWDSIEILSEDSCIWLWVTSKLMQSTCIVWAWANRSVSLQFFRRVEANTGTVNWNTYIAVSLWPTSSKSLVASFPAASLRTSSPPGCWKGQTNEKANISHSSIRSFPRESVCTYLVQKFGDIVNLITNYNPQIRFRTVPFHLGQCEFLDFRHFIG